MGLSVINSTIVKLQQLHAANKRRKDVPGILRIIAFEVLGKQYRTIDKNFSDGSSKRFLLVCHSININ